MRLAERSRHEWKIENIGFWTYTSPIQGPEFVIEYVGDVIFSYSLQVKDTNEVTLVLKGTATPTSPCYVPLRVSACVLTPDREEVSLTSKDVEPFSETSSALLTLFSLDGDERKCLEQDYLTLLIRISERLVSVRTQITNEDRISSSKVTKIASIRSEKNRYLPDPTSVHRSTNGKNDVSFYYEIYRFTRNPTSNDCVQFRLYSNKIYSPKLLRARPSLIDRRGRIRKIGKFGSFLFREDLEVWYVPDSIPLSLLEEKEVDTMRVDIEYSAVHPSRNSYWIGTTSVTHSYRHTVVFLDSVTQDDILPKLERDRWTDLNLLTEDGMSFPVHRCVLVARSRYFEAMLTTNMAEKDKKEIHLKAVDSGVLGHLLDFLYSVTLPEDLSVEMMVDVYFLANYLEVLELCTFCLHHIMKKLRLSNIMSVLPLLKFEPDLEKEVQRIIASNAEQVFQSPSWKELKEKHPELCEPFTNLGREEMNRTDSGYSTRNSCDNPPVINANEAYDAITLAVRNMLL